MKLEIIEGKAHLVVKTVDREITIPFSSLIKTPKPGKAVTSNFIIEDDIPISIRGDNFKEEKEKNRKAGFRWQVWSPLGVPCLGDADGEENLYVVIRGKSWQELNYLKSSKDFPEYLKAPMKSLNSHLTLFSAGRLLKGEITDGNWVVFNNLGEVHALDDLFPDGKGMSPATVNNPRNRFTKHGLVFSRVKSKRNKDQLFYINVQSQKRDQTSETTTRLQYVPGFEEKRGLVLRKPEGKDLWFYSSLRHNPGQGMNLTDEEQIFQEILAESEAN